MNTVFNRSFITIIICCLLLCMISGCASKGEVFNEGSLNPVKEAVGIYIGDKGGMFTLCEDGSADYFGDYYYCPKQDMKWTYAKNRIYIRYSDSVTVYASASDLSVNEYVFKSDDKQGWAEENYTKVTGEAHHMTRDESLALMRDSIEGLYPDKAADITGQLNANMASCSDYEFGGLIFGMPVFYSESENGSFRFISREGESGIYFFTYEKGSIPDPQFDKYKKELDDEYEKVGLSFLDDIKRTYEGERTVASSLKCSETYYSGTFDGRMAQVRVALINNTARNQLVRMYVSYPDDFPGYEAVYEQLLDTVALADADSYARIRTNNVFSDVDYEKGDEVAASAASKPAKDEAEKNVEDSTPEENAPDDTTEAEAVDAVEAEPEAAAKEPEYVYAITRVRIRKEPNTDCDVLGALEEGEKIEKLDDANDEWSRVKYEDSDGYIKSEYLTNEAP